MTRPETILPLTLSRRHITVTPTRYGTLFLILLGAMLAGSVNYNNNLGFLLVFLLGGILLVSLLHGIGNLLGLKVMSVSANPVFAGNWAVFSVDMDSGRRMRSAMKTGLGSNTAVLESLVQETRKAFLVKVAAENRGWLRPDPLIIESLFPLGLFSVRAWLCSGASCLVYPKPVSGSLTMTGNYGTGSDEHDRTNPGIDDFQGLAPYQPGHGIGRIAWKALSRGQGVFIKDFSADQGAPVMFDFEAMGQAGTEQRLSCLCGMVLRAAAMNLEYGLKLPGIILTPARGDMHKSNCLKTLALFAVNGDHP